MALTKKTTKNKQTNKQTKPPVSRGKNESAEIHKITLRNDLLEGREGELRNHHSEELFSSWG